MMILRFIETDCCVNSFGDFCVLDTENEHKDVETRLSSVPFSLFESKKRGERKRMFHQIWGD